MATIGIACGGTGGHLYPGLAVAEVLRASGHEVRIYISNKEIDRKVLEGYGQYPSIALPTVGWPGLNPAVVGFCRKFVAAYRQSVHEIREHRLSAVLGMGGFTSAPLLLSASRRNIPTLLHESNAIPGKVTKLLARQAHKVLLGYGECANHLQARKCHVTGTPIRASLGKVERQEAAAYWDLDPETLTLSVIGGSQGAAGLNQLIIQLLPELGKGLPLPLQMIHITGPRDVELMEANYRRFGIRAAVRPFCEKMEYLYNMTDIIVARSGAASLTEISHFGLPSILVPYPHAAEDHQYHNAKIFEKTGAGVIIREGSGAVEKLSETLKSLISDETRIRAMADKARDLGSGNAAERVAQEVENVL